LECITDWAASKPPTAESAQASNAAPPQPTTGRIQVNTNQTSARSSYLDKLPQTLNTANSISTELHNLKGSVMKTKMSSSKTQATLLSGALAAAVLALNAHATSLESLATAPEAQENTARRPVQQGIEDSQSILSQAENLARTQGLQVSRISATQRSARTRDVGVGSPAGFRQSSHHYG
jgi:hypothetical protein